MENYNDHKENSRDNGAKQDQSGQRTENKMTGSSDDQHNVTGQRPPLRGVQDPRLTDGNYTRGELGDDETPKNANNPEESVPFDRQNQTRIDAGSDDERKDEPGDQSETPVGS